MCHKMIDYSAIYPDIVEGGEHYVWQTNVQLESSPDFTVQHIKTIGTVPMHIEDKITNVNGHQLPDYYGVWIKADYVALFKQLMSLAATPSLGAWKRFSELLAAPEPQLLAATA